MTAQNTPPLMVPSQADIDKTFPGGTRRIWEKSHSLTLYSIRPARELPFSDQTEKVDSLDNEYPILGKVVVRVSD